MDGLSLVSTSSPGRASEIPEYGWGTSGEPFEVLEAVTAVFSFIDVHQQLDASDVVVGGTPPSVPLRYSRGNPKPIQPLETLLICLAIQVMKWPNLGVGIMIEVVKPKGVRVIDP